MPALSTRIVLDCFYLLIFYSEKFSTDVCRLPYAVNVNLNLSIDSEPIRARGIIVKCKLPEGTGKASSVCIACVASVSV